jgi:sialate O-acetylesterase
MAAKYRHYETKIQPLAGYAMRGTLWYQGEGNQKDGRNYLPKMKQLISEWRTDWNQVDFPFYFVQLAPIGESPADNPAGGDGRAEIRQAQVEALAMPNTAMAVTIDIGDKKEHPINKHDIGLRLARIALHRDYGRKELVPCGPLYQSHTIEGSAIRVKFHYSQNGLMLARKDGFNPPAPTPGASIPWLSIQAKDGKWHWADGKIDGSDLLVSSKEVKEPVAVRFAYTNQPVGFNLYNKDGLPASPFTTCGYDPK